MGMFVMWDSGLNQTNPLCSVFGLVENDMQKRFSQDQSSSRRFVWYVTLLSTLLSANSAEAQVTTTTSETMTGTVVTQSGNAFEVSGGTQAGINLFHKFDDFSIQQNESVNFASDPSISNVIGQVVGGSPSYIDGQIQVSGSDANLYLVNPFGVLFGPNAQTLLPGSLTVTSADDIYFDEAGWLGLLDVNPFYTRFTAAPSALVFTEDSAAAVVNQGSLSVLPGESILMIGGNVINEGQLEAPGGEIGLIAVGGRSTARLAAPGSLLSLDIAGESSLPALQTRFAYTDLPSLLTGRSNVGINAAATGLSLLQDGTVSLSDVRIEDEEVSVSGQISTRSLSDPGGTVALLGRSVDVNSAVVDASGAEGGTVRIGTGDVGALADSDVLFVDFNSSISADGALSNGGAIEIQSSNRAYVGGTLSAKGAGDGGTITTSATQLSLLAGTSIDAGGQTAPGQWLASSELVDIDSLGISLNKISSATIADAIDNNTAVTIATNGPSAGDISLLNDINQTGTSAAGLTLSGRRFITNGSSINLDSQGDLTFEINKVNPLLITNSSSIEAAIASIGNVNGDSIVKLSDGTYDFSNAVVVDADVRIEGTSAANTVLRAVDSNRVFEVSPGITAAVSDLTFTTAGVTSSQRSGGINNLGDLTVERSLFTENRADQGGAIYADAGSTLTVVDSEFSDNRAFGSGGGINASNSRVDIQNATFTGNSALQRGGAINADRNTVLSVADSTVENNTADERGGGISTTAGSETSVVNSNITNNSATRGGGLYGLRSSSIDILGSTLQQNSSTIDGGALSVEGGILSITDSALVQNSAADDAGALHLLGNTNATLTNVTVADNTAQDMGGGLYQFDRSVLSVVDSVVRNNVAGNEGGGLHRNSAFETRTTITGTSFTGNRAVNSGGGLFSRSGGSIAIQNSNFTANEASQQDGGALSLVGDATTSIVGSTFEQNTSADQGGAISVGASSDLTIQDARFERNTSVSDGGAIAHNASEQLSIIDTQFNENTSSENGGAIFTSSGATSIDNTTFSRNQAVGKGGGLIAVGSDLTIQNGTTFTGNSAEDGGGLLTYETVSTIDDTTFNNNRSTGDGGGIAAHDRSNMTVRNSTIGNNAAGDDGGGLYATYGATVVVEDTTVGSNSASDLGGGLYASGGSSLTAERVNLVGNSAATNGGGIAVRDSDAVVLESTLRDNVSSARGGGLYQASGQLDVSDTAFIGNSAGGDGGGTAIVGSAIATVNNTTFRSNRAEGIGGAIAAYADGPITVANSAFSDNITQSQGGAIAAAANAEVTIEDGVFERNQAVHGGAIASVSSAKVTLRDSRLNNNIATTDGGGVRVTDTAIATIERTAITNNSARYGAGIELSASGSGTVIDSEIAANQADVRGGGIRADNNSYLNLIGSTLADNQAGAAGGLSVVGTADLVNVTISGNSVSQDGGGVMLNDGGTLMLNSSTITENSAAEAGGISVRDALSTAELSNTIVAGNTASDSLALADLSGAFTDSGNNLIGVADDSMGFTQSSYVGTAAAPLASGLLSLDDNGGLTRTHLLQTDSVAVNAGDNGVVSSATDQRKADRVVGAAVDIGAVELTAAELPAELLNAIAPNAPIPEEPVVIPTPVVDPPIDAPVVDPPTTETPTDAPTPPDPILPEPTDPNVVSQTPNEIDPESSPTDSLLSSLIDSPSFINSGFIDLESTNLGSISSDPTNSDQSTLTALPTAQRRDVSDDNRSVQKLEQTFGQSFEDYWDLSLGPDLSFDEVQAVLRRAQEAYQVNSAVIYATFEPEKQTLENNLEENKDNVLSVAVEPADNDLLNLSVVMPAGELVSYQLPFTREQVTSQVARFRSTVSDPVDDFSYQPFAHRAYQWLLAPLEEDLAAQGIQNLMYALDTGLRTAPITAMKDDNGFSLERFGISVIPNVGLMQTDFGTPVRRGTVAMGVSEFESQEPLPAVPVELSMVDEFAPASQTVLNEGTTLAALEAIQALEQPGLLHLATHATFDDHSPQSSYIQLWDEPLSMSEFRQLDWERSDLELLILSACLTAMSSPNAELGFAGLAAASGVDATMGSLWRVSDVGTLALMSEFYAQLGSADLRFEALRQAQLALMKGETRIEDGRLITSGGEVALPEVWAQTDEATLDHPFFWSAFALVGNPW